MPGPLETRRVYMSKELTCLRVFELCFLLSVFLPSPHRNMNECVHRRYHVLRCTDLGTPVGHLRCETQLKIQACRNAEVT